MGGNTNFLHLPLRYYKIQVLNLEIKMYPVYILI